MLGLGRVLQTVATVGLLATTAAASKTDGTCQAGDCREGSGVQHFDNGDVYGTVHSFGRIRRHES